VEEQYTLTKALGVQVLPTYAAGTNVRLFLDGESGDWDDPANPETDIGFSISYCRGRPVTSKYVLELAPGGGTVTSSTTSSVSRTACRYYSDSSRTIPGPLSALQLCDTGSGSGSSITAFTVAGHYFDFNLTNDNLTPVNLEVKLKYADGSTIPVSTGWRTSSVSYSCSGGDTASGTIAAPEQGSTTVCTNANCVYRAYYAPKTQSTVAGWNLDTMCGIDGSGAVLFATAIAPSGSSHPYSFTLPTTLIDGDYAIGITVSQVGGGFETAIYANSCNGHTQTSFSSSAVPSSSSSTGGSGSGSASSGAVANAVTSLRVLIAVIAFALTAVIIA
jgi:hypothetical protein